MSKTIIFILVVLVFLLACFFLFQLLNQRSEIKNQYILEKEEQKKIKLQKALEGFSLPSLTYSDATTEAKNIATQIFNQIDTSPTDKITTQNKNDTINELCIFSSWNTACSGKFVSKDQIVNVIASGCRMLHFTITNYNNQPTIFGNFTDNSNNGVLLQDALNTCKDNAYRHQITVKTNNGNQYLNLTNYKDPLIIMLSFKYFSKDDVKAYEDEKSKNPDKKLSNPYYTTDFFNNCANSVDNAFNNRLHRDGNKNAISIYKVKKHQINQKIIIITDITGINQDNTKTQNFNNSNLNKYSNLICGNENGIMLYPFKDLSPKDNKTVNNNDAMNQKFIMAVPDNDQNPALSDFVKCSFYQRCQFIPVVFYSSDFTNIMKFFQDKHSAFISFKDVNKEILYPNNKAVMG